MNDFKAKVEEFQSLGDKDHLENIIKILDFNFWSDDERLFFIWMYVKMVIRKIEWDNMPSSYKNHLKRFFRILS